MKRTFREEHSFALAAVNPPEEERSRVKFRSESLEPHEANTHQGGQIATGELPMARAARIQQLVAEAEARLASLSARAPEARMLRTAMVRRDGVLLDALLRRLRAEAR